LKLRPVAARGDPLAAVFLRRVEFVVSHPFARKKAKGWGTGLCGVGECRKGTLGEVVVSQPFARKKAKGWGTGVCGGGECGEGTTGGVCGFPAFRQCSSRKAGERMGNGEFWGNGGKVVRIEGSSKGSKWG
jgi:hypothetical protein